MSQLSFCNCSCAFLAHLNFEKLQVIINNYLMSKCLIAYLPSLLLFYILLLVPEVGKRRDRGKCIIVGVKYGCLEFKKSKKS